MAYDFVRWGFGLVLFAVLLAVLIIKKKDKAKSALISAFTAIILSALLLFVPIENVFYSFKSAEKIYTYAHHEELVSVAECDEGIVCVGKKDESNYVYYSFNKSSKGYKLPNQLNDNTQFHSSKFGIYIIKQFNEQTIILTQAKDSSYNGEEFKPTDAGYYYAVIGSPMNFSHLYCGDEQVTLI